MVNKTAKITLNRPKKLNALSLQLQAELSEALWEADNDREVHSVIIKGAGKAFSAGYDLTGEGNNVPVSRIQNDDRSYRGGRSIDDDAWQLERGQRYRMTLFDMHKPVIAQVHGYCLAGGTELAASCDLVYVANNAEIGYPVVRSMSPPDNQFFPWLMGMRNAMEMMLTGESISGEEAVSQGFANKSFDLEKISEEVIKIAEKVAKVPSDIQAINKRAVHRQMEAMGMRTGIRAGTEMQALAMHSKSTQEHLKELASGLKEALTKRDKEFGDYRTKEKD